MKTHSLRLPYQLLALTSILLASSLESAAFTVTTNADSGAGSLREAMAASNADTAVANTIDFNSGLGTITLLSPLPRITQSVTLTGPVDRQTIDGGGTFRGFFVDAPASSTVELQNLTVQNVLAKGGNGGNSTGAGGGGGGGLGGAVFVKENTTVTLDTMTFAGCQAVGGNGGTGGTSAAGGGGGGGLGGNGGAGPGNGAGGGGGIDGAGGTSNIGKLGAGGGGGSRDSTSASAPAPTGGAGGSTSSGAGGGGGGGITGAGAQGATNNGGNGSGGASGGITGSRNGAAGSGGNGGGGGYGPIFGSPSGHGGAGSSSTVGGGGGGGGGSTLTTGSGGNGGVGGSGAGGGGGGGGSSAGTNGNGGTGGFGGGGGGAGATINCLAGVAGSGGFGGGGGGGGGGKSTGPLPVGGSGGFGGGGGGGGVTQTAGSPPAGGTSGEWGGSGGAGSVYPGASGHGGGGGGAGLGGAIFLQSNGTLVIHDAVFSGNSVTGGSGGTAGTGGTAGSAGQSSSPDLFMMSGSFLILDTSYGVLELQTPVSCELGAGEITKKGNGTVILSGPGKYLGKIKVLGGDLFFGGPNSSTRHFEMAQVGKELIGEPRLHLAHEDEWVHSETIDGLNSLHKSGGGVLTLTGDNTYVGPTSVMEGTLRVNGSITSDVTVHPGATLGGTGVIAGNVAMGGTMAPGASIGTTTVVGNYDQLSGSTFEVELNASMNDFLTVSGGVTIHPETTLVLLPESGGYRPGQTFNIVHADGGVQGIFSTVNLRGNAFTPQILYTSDDIFLLILNINLSSRVSGGNAGNVATYLDSLTSPANSDLSSVVAVAASLNNAGLKDALNQMQPSSLKDFVIAQEGASFLVESSVQQRLRDVNHTTCPRQNPGLSFWMDDAYQFASQNSEGQNVGYHAATFAVTAGLDYDYMKDLYVGFFTSYSYSSLSLQRHRGNGFTETFYGGTYATYASKYVDASAILMGSTHRMHAKRFIDFSTIDRTAYSVRRGGEVDGHLDLGVRIQRGSILVRPYGTVDYLYLHESEYAEHGADSLDLVVRSSNSALFRYEIGLGLTDCYRFNDQRGYFEAKAGVAHEQRYFGKEYTLHFRGQPGNFTVNGLSPTRTVFVPAFSWSHLFEKFTLSLRAEGEVGSKYAMGELGLQATF